MSDSALSQIPVTILKGVGPKSAERLARLGIHTVQDILFHLPARYQDRTRVVPIGSLRVGEQAVIDGEIELADVRFGKRRSLMVRVADGTGAIMLRFFYFTTAQKNGLTRGTRVRCFGEVRSGPSTLELVHPEYQTLGLDDVAPMEESLTPIYPTTEGMHQLTWRDLTDKALDLLRGRAGLDELLPVTLCESLQMPDLVDAITQLHRPSPDISLDELDEREHPAQRRLAFEELLAHQISLRLVRQQQQLQGAPALQSQGELAARFEQSLPFSLTTAQQRVSVVLAQDMSQTRPMLRLVQGDVGSGKTVVAALAALRAIEAGYQVALMAPTELLAEQHRNNFQAWFTPLNVTVSWLSGRQKGKARAAVLAELATGAAQVVVGTHALFQEDVYFQRLGLVIVDEQHRFGVHQRMALRDKANGLLPHQLIMTATPIPRTLAMTAYADLDVSVIDELPPGRKPVTTVLVSDSRRNEVIQRVQGACQEGRQAYWVCTLIEESEALQCQTAEETLEMLTEVLPDIRCGLVHGRMKAKDKAAVMTAFKAGELQLLIATTVIEVGVDVPNASLMIIENAERLGLSQLHQLRGRVGRGSAESHCVLMYKAPLSQQAQQRLAVMRQTNDGFVVAQKDLEIRGPGEVLGTRQTGEMQFKVADLMCHQAMVPQVQQTADSILRANPDLAKGLMARWIGDKTKYANV